MKIPIYQSQASLTRETPGRSISARQSMSGPRAIVEQGQVLTTALNEVTSYAEMRYKMLDETQRNEAIFGAKEQIRDVLYRMKNGTDTSVLEGEPSAWDNEMQSIKQSLLDTFGGSKASRFMFDQEFQVAASNAKFSLRDAIDDKIETRHKASQKELKNQIVRTYGSPDMDLESLQTEMASFNEILIRSMKNQTITPGLAQEIGEDALPDVAEQLVMGWAGTNVQRVLNLYEALTAFQDLGTEKDEADFVETGRNAQREFLEIGADGGNYTLQVMLAIQPGDANKILANALNQASKFARIDDEVNKRNNETEQAIANRIFTLAISDRLKAQSETEDTPKFFLSDLKEVYNPPEGYNQSLLQQLGAKSFGNKIQLDGPSVQLFLQDVLRSNRFFSQNSKKSAALEKSISENTRAANYADNDVDAVIELIDDNFRDGTMTMEILNENRESLTRKTFNAFEDQIENNLSADKTETKNLINEYFKEIGNRLGAQIDENTAGDIAAGISKGAVKEIVGELRKKIRERKQDNNPMSFDEVEELGERLLLQKEKQKIINLRRRFKIEYKNTLDDPQPGGPLTINLNSPTIIADPRAALDAAYDALSDELKRQNGSNYLTLLGLIGRFEAHGAFGQ